MVASPTALGAACAPCGHSQWSHRRSSAAAGGYCDARRGGGLLRCSIADADGAHGRALDVAQSVGMHTIQHRERRAPFHARPTSFLEFPIFFFFFSRTRELLTGFAMRRATPKGSSLNASSYFSYRTVTQRALRRRATCRRLSLPRASSRSSCCLTTRMSTSCFGFVPHSTPGVGHHRSAPQGLAGQPKGGRHG